MFGIRDETLHLKKAMFGKASPVVKWGALAQTSCGGETSVSA
jgi:hypothetical protein